MKVQLSPPPPTPSIMQLLTNKIFYFQHPDYEVGPGAFPNDIGLVHLANAVGLSPERTPITMAEGDEDFANEECIISGWGRLGK